MPAVVVLPLVALTIVEPRSSREAMRWIASGDMRTSRRPGSVVPPPRPLRLLSAPTDRAKASFALKNRLMSPRLGGLRGRDHAQRAAPHG